MVRSPQRRRHGWYGPRQLIGRRLQGCEGSQRADRGGNGASQAVPATLKVPAAPLGVMAGAQQHPIVRSKRVSMLHATRSRACIGAGAASNTTRNSNPTAATPEIVREGCRQGRNRSRVLRVAQVQVRKGRH